MVRNSLDQDTPHNRAQAVVRKHLDYMNYALANSEIPIRYVQWGDIQDIGKTEQQIGSGCPTKCTQENGRDATRTANDIYDR